ncbi:restriction endonuclease [Moraxella bovis]|uniref:Tsp45I type II restriction enzyme n=1 Tax=Moraxella bovis TaxID=476 RepID=A0A378PSA6_MORBO|nr:restriction endonuclease [Moraxella bovis]STY91466.1 Tsp45I type II restriction enzyme [Moraxella bovis]
MNIWTQKSIELANQSNYLDLLYKVYPMSVNLRRELSLEVQKNIQTHLNNKDGKNLLKLLLTQEIFPIKDSYVAYLKRDKTAIDRNPNTVSRLAGMLIEMGFDEILDKTTAPKETNRQIGPLFKNWINSGVLGVQTTSDIEYFFNHQGDIVFSSSDQEMQFLANNFLRYRINKGLDFIAKFNNQIIIAEVKFLTDFGGHQNAQFNDAIRTMKSILDNQCIKIYNDYIPVKSIAILDGVLYLDTNQYLSRMVRGYRDSDILISAVLLRDYLYSL